VKRSGIPFKLCASLVSILVFFLLAEGILAGIDYFCSSQNKQTEKTKSDHSEGHRSRAPPLKVAPPYLASDPLIFTSLIKGFCGVSHGVTVRINSFGFRGPEISRIKPSHVTRILCLGDSITFGWGVEEEDSYPFLLEKILNTNLPDIMFQVVNAGIPTHSSWQGYLRLKKTHLLEYSPDVVVISYGFNDQVPHKERDKNRSNPVRVKNLSPGIFRRYLTRTHTHKYLKRLLEPVLVSRPNQTTHNRVRVPRDDFRENLESMLQILDGHQISTVFLDQIYADVPNSDYNQELYTVAERFNIKTARISSQLKNVEEQLSDDKNLYLDECHFNSLGNRVVAETVAYIVEELEQ